MDAAVFVSFLAVSAVLIIVPGPNVLLITATTLARGRQAGLLTVAGTTTALAVQMAITVTGTAWLASVLADAFVWIKWAGVAYLMYLGVGRIVSALRPRNPDTPQPVGRNSTFWRGFFVSITNPKTILFFGAFLPQFTTSSLPMTPQLVLLSASFLTLATILDSCYALAADELRRVASRPRFRRLADGIAGTLFLGAGFGLAVARRQ